MSNERNPRFVRIRLENKNRIDQWNFKGNQSEKEEIEVKKRKEREKQDDHDHEIKGEKKEKTKLHFIRFKGNFKIQIHITFQNLILLHIYIHVYISPSFCS